jgi:hypothetical protein
LASCRTLCPEIRNLITVAELSLLSSNSGSEREHDRAVEVVYNREQVQIEPPCPAVAAQLNTLKLVAAPDDAHGYRLQAQQESLLAPALPRPNAGLLPAVCRSLVQAGCRQITVRRASAPPGELPVPDENAVRRHGRCDAALLALIRTNDHGLIRHDGQGGADLAWMLAQIALAFPQATLAIVVASRDAGHRLQRRMGRWLRGVTFLDARPNTRPVGRVAVGTPYGMADDDVEFNKRDFVIFPRAQDALSERSQTALMAADPKFRLFGFLPVDCQLSPYERDWIRAMFGFSEVTVPRHGFINRPVRTILLPMEGGPRLSPGASLLALKRHGVWLDPVRNRRIARIARTFSCQNIGWLRAQMQETEAENPAAACRVVVLVDAVDHAIALADLLPGWPPIVGDAVVLDGLNGDQRRLLAGRRAMSGTSGSVITTTAEISRHGALNPNAFDVVVWAGAGAHLPPLPADRLISLPEQARGLLVVDFADRHHPQLRRWSRFRREAYVDAGWVAPGANPMLARIDRFLAQRPGGSTR